LALFAAIYTCALTPRRARTHKGICADNPKQACKNTPRFYAFLPQLSVFRCVFERADVRKLLSFSPGATGQVAIYHYKVVLFAKTPKQKC